MFNSLSAKKSCAKERRAAELNITYFGRE